MWCWLFPTLSLSSLVFFAIVYHKRLLFLYRLSSMKVPPTSSSKFILNATGVSALITYNRDNESYMLNIPFKRDLIRKMSGSKAYLVKDDQQINITQQPGIAYNVTARELGGNKIIVRKGDNIMEFGPDEIPML